MRGAVLLWIWGVLGVGVGATLWEEYGMQRAPNHTCWRGGGSHGEGWLCCLRNGGAHRGLRCGGVGGSG